MNSFLHRTEERFADSYGNADDSRAAAHFGTPTWHVVTLSPAFVGDGTDYCRGDRMERR